MFAHGLQLSVVAPVRAERRAARDGPRDASTAMTDAPTPETEESTLDELHDADALRDRDDVVVEERERPMPDEKFEGLRERYDATAGVVQVGLTNDDGDVLLWGEEAAAPPGGSVGDGEDWVAAARGTIEDLTGQTVSIDDPLVLEVTYFHREGDETERFPAPSVHFAASLVDPDDEWVANPSVPDDFDHPMFDDRPTVRWYSAVTDDIDDNHAHHVEHYLD